jgi:hypothetical protein
MNKISFIMKKGILLLLSILVLSLSNSCKKVEGSGGGATIKGMIQEQKYNALGNIIAEYPGSDVDVYLIYGTTDQFYDDDVKTSYDGSFVFQYLQKGRRGNHRTRQSSNPTQEGRAPSIAKRR